MTRFFAYPFVAVLFLAAASHVFGDGSGEELRVFFLKHANCKAMVTLLADLSEGELTTGIDERTNSIVIKAQAETLDVIGNLLQELDREIKKTERHEQEPDVFSSRTARRRGLQNLPPNLSTIASPANGTIQSIAEHDRKVRKGDVVATIVVGDSGQETGEQDLALPSIEEHALRKREQVEVKSQQANAERRLHLLERKLSMAEANIDLQQAILETELAVGETKLRGLQTQVEIAEERVRSGEQTGSELAMLKTELMLAQRSLSVQRHKLQFHVDHAFPTERLELELQIAEVKESVLQASNRQQEADRAARARHENLDKGRAKQRTKRVLKIAASRDGLVSNTGYNGGRGLRAGAEVREGQLLLVIRPERTAQ